MKLVLKTFLVLAIVLAGCAPQAAPQNPSPSASTQAAPTALAVLPSATPEPSPTPEPGKVILSAPGGSDVQAIQAALSELSTDAGLTLETATDLQPAGISQNVRVVVLAVNPGNLNELLAAAPNTQFVTLASTNVPASANLTVIRTRPENQAFLGGFIAVLLSTDWRSAGLLPNDGPLGENLQDAFINGGHYFCGVCAPGWPLGVYYPQVGAASVSADGPTWQAVAAGLFDNLKVEAYYLAAEAYRQEVFDYLQGKDQFGKTLLLAGALPPPDALRAQWAATVGFDTPGALRQAWPDVLAGKGGVVVEVPLALTDVNAANLGEGRLRLVNDLMEELRTGMIYPYSIPAQ
jgi:hypothetical protein